ncbi:hypothetical protein CIY_31720 [Butyrivibrio fibrisolvens 16/4]|nr:hypothetical protein CIY_31720 [Butyrivibrio fibrisolvens 16/4]
MGCVSMKDEKGNFEELFERTDCLSKRKTNKLDLENSFTTPDKLKQMKELGPEGIYERFGLNYVF